ncbi:hypothetical protein [Treponema zioleckii]|uniref:hypothetical protein n=1 Tax=Treponema zioleckii TaxID=331680 RepID=UPI00168BFB94|nr:hypothetical protein [Treponema zioleckii]
MFILLFVISFIVYPVQVRIDYLPYDLCTLEPLGIANIKNTEKKYLIKNIDYFRICSLLRKLEKTYEINFDDNVQFELDLDWDEDENQNDLNNEIVKKITEPQSSSIRKVKIIDRFVNVRYVVNFSDSKKIKRIALGHSKNIIIVNDDFYSIPIGDYKKLLFFFSGLINDKINVELNFPKGLYD